MRGQKQCGECPKETKTPLRSEARCRRFIHRGLTCAEEVLQKKEAKGWKDGLSLAGPIHNHYCLGKRYLLAQRKGWREGNLTVYLRISDQ